MRLFRLLAMFAVLALGVSHTAKAQDAIEIGKSGEINLAGVIEYVEDPTSKLRIDDALQSHTWKLNPHRTFNQGYNDSAWWLKVRIHNPGPNQADMLLEVGYAVLDHVDIYVIDHGEIRQTFNLGDKLPHSQRPVDHRFFAVPVAWQPQQTLDIYLRIQSSSSIQAPLTLWNYGRFYSVDTASTILQGIYYGGMLVIAIYNLLIYFVLRERSYLYYVCFVLSMPMFMAALSGQSFRYLWPNATTWNDQAVIVFLASTLVFAPLFTRRFLNIDALSRPLAKALNGLAAFSLLIGLGAFALPYAPCIHILVPLGLVTSLFSFGAGIYALVRGQTSARTYVVAWSVFLLGASMLALNKLNLLPNNLITEYATQFGSMIEVVLLSFALAQRINVERRLRFEAQTETLQATRKLNEELEQRVSERTIELENLNQRLQELSDTDQLTGLKNRRYLEQRLKEEWARALRQRQSLALVMIDIDHFKSINDTHGHIAGDVCLQQVAQLIGDGLRWPADIAARYGGEEFCMVLPQTNGSDAVSVAERVRTQVEKAIVTINNTNLAVTISCGVFAAVPDDSLSADELVRRADMALYQSKRAGRNNTTLSESLIS